MKSNKNNNPLFLEFLGLLIILVTAIESTTPTTVINGESLVDQQNKPIQLQFPVYVYKRKSQFERDLSRMQSACATSNCSQVSNPLKRLACVMRCSSPKCYDEIYASNPLEEGEVDQRLNSYKGCISEEKKQKSMTQAKQKKWGTHTQN